MAASDFIYVNIRDYLSADCEASKPLLEATLKNYACPLNPDVEHFLKHNAVDFARRNQSVTYLVFAATDGALVGYFTIALKAITVNAATLSNTVRKRFARLSDLDAASNAYTLPAFLIAQIGKNYADGLNERIAGSALLHMAWNVITELQYAAGGVVAFLEAEDNAKLLQFYIHENNFRQFSVRQSSTQGKTLIQLLKPL